jgi:molybdopterin-guanine dinucleotide biosynthesis protein A
MGFPKHLLQCYDGLPAYQNRLEMLQSAIPDAKSICLYLREPSQQAEVESPPGFRLELLYESSLMTTNFRDLDTHTGSIAGLLVAFQTDPTCDWLVMPCDYPLMTAKEVKRLYDTYEDPITCFENGQGLLEPYAAIWSPQALALLEERVSNGLTDRSVPRDVISDLNGTRVRPLYFHSLFNTNTMEDWEHAMSLLSSENHIVINGTET